MSKEPNQPVNVDKEHLHIIQSMKQNQRHSVYKMLKKDQIEPSRQYHSTTTETIFKGRFEASVSAMTSLESTSF